MSNQTDIKKFVPFSEYVQLALSHAAFIENDDGTWTVEVSHLPGCVTWGESREEAMEMALDAIEGWVLKHYVLEMRFQSLMAALCVTPAIWRCKRRPERAQAFSRETSNCGSQVAQTGV